jgi:hypothetical protein
MKRMLIGLFALSFPYAVQAAETYRHVDIGDSRALDAIQAANPAQYEKVIGILQQVAGSVSCETLPQMLKVQYGAEQFQCMVAHPHSYPPSATSPQLASTAPETSC